MGKKLEKSIRGKKVFKHDKDFPIVKDGENDANFFQNLGDFGDFGKFFPESWRFW